MEVYEKYVGKLLDDRYKIEKIIGIGGMAVVFRAYDTLMKRIVAIKMLKQEIAGDNESVMRFVNESKAVSMMNHRNIVRIYDVNVRNDIKYISMEYIDGVTLRSYMAKREHLSLKEIISYTEQILSALSHAHQKGVVHRDIKPQNIMILKSGIIKVTDFGIAKLPNAETVTMSDKAIGTVFYISPEQASGQEIDARSDIYSLGIMMYEMATGKLPFNSDSPVTVAMMQISDEAKKPSELVPDIPKGLEQVICCCMEKDPLDRYQNAEEMLRHLHKLRDNPKAIFKIRKHGDPSEPKTLWQLIRNGGALFPVIAGVFLAFIIVFTLSAVYIFGQISKAAKNVGETITIDEFVGSKLTSDLQKWFDSSDIYDLKVNYIYSENYDADLIIEQDPLPQSQRKVVPNEQKCEIILTVSSGVQAMEIPDLIYLDYREAQQQLKARGFFCTIEYAPSHDVQPGQVISTSPVAGEKLNMGESVTITVCKGNAEGDIEVPEFIGKTEKQAFKMLVELELLPGKITYIKSTKPRGTVTAQGYANKAKVNKNTRINLTISGGDKYDPKNPDGTTAETTKAPETTKKKVETTAAKVTTAPPEVTEAVTTVPVVETTQEPEETTGDVEETTAETDNETTEEPTT